MKKIAFGVRPFLFHRFVDSIPHGPVEEIPVLPDQGADPSWMCIPTRREILASLEPLRFRSGCLMGSRLSMERPATSR